MSAAQKMNEFAGQLVRELFAAYQGAFCRYVDPAGRALTKETFQWVYAAALMRVAASLANDMSEEDFLELAIESRRQELRNRSGETLPAESHTQSNLRLQG